MENKKQVVHIVNRTAFATGYIEFMRVHFSEYAHCFILLREGVKLELDNDNDIIYVGKYKELYFERNVKQVLFSCDKIIVTGIWDMTEYLYLCGKKVLAKTYFHFWGGDFYRYREFSTRELKFSKFVLRKTLKKSAGVINLIEKDYGELKNIVGISDMKHFVAPMPKNPKENIDYASYRRMEKKNNTYRIIVGNSATVYNQHKEIFDILHKYKEADIQIVCPLTYGKDEYRQEVIEMGTKYFGDKFLPVTKQLPKDEYVAFLSGCDIGIFNNNRQQAMGNISIFARLGKKVYLREDTSMWEHFENIGYQFNTIEQLKEASLEEIIHFDPQVKENNILAREKWEQQTVVLWNKVLGD